MENELNTKNLKYIRLPKPGKRCSITQLNRSAMNNLILACKANNFRPPVKSSVLKKDNARRGIRLIDYRSLMDYLESQTDKSYISGKND